MSSIHYLSGRGDIYELHSLLESGADPNERSPDDGKTPVMKAAKANNRIAVKLLLKFGADLNATDAQGSSALLDAQDTEMVRFLIESGADSKVGRFAGMTPLAVFANFGNRELVDLLISHGADPRDRLRSGHTVEELLADPDHRWDAWRLPDTPEHRSKNAQTILQLSENLTLPPEEYVSRHRDIIIFGYHTYAYDDPAVEAWAKRVGELLASPYLREEVYRRYLTGDELARAMAKLQKDRDRAERKRLREERLAEFEAIYLND